MGCCKESVGKKAEPKKPEEKPVAKPLAVGEVRRYGTGGVLLGKK